MKGMSKQVICKTCRYWIKGYCTHQKKKHYFKRANAFCGHHSFIKESGLKTIMKVIRTKLQAKEFFEEMPEQAININHLFVFEDSSLSMQGRTSLYKHEGKAYRFSSGKNWMDQEESEIDAQWIWEHRKDINDEIRRQKELSSKMYE